MSDSALLGAAQIRALADRLGVRPTKQWGQNFVIDANTVTRIVRVAGVGPDDHVIEIGPGLGSLTLALLPAVAHVTAIEVDPNLASALPETVASIAPGLVHRLTVVQADALQVPPAAVMGSEAAAASAGDRPPPTALVANLPYNVSVPVVLRFLELFPSIERILVMVQLEVAERLAAPPGNKTYGVPSAKAAWYAEVRLAGLVPRSVFWPVPNVDSGLVSFQRRPEPEATATREQVFAVIDAAFAQRRKTLRAALASWAGSAPEAERFLRAAGVDPTLRGERLGIEDFARIASAAAAASGPSVPPA